jgi:TRAP-type C4-dicarboxylate transport system substrate-binding protein
MAKYLEPFEDTQDLFTKKIKEAGLSNFLTITIIVNNTAKDVYKLLKPNDLFKHRSGDDILIIINEQIFDQLPDDQKSIIADEALAEISYDTENDKVSIVKPTFVAHDGVLDKYGYDVLKVVREAVKTLYQVEKQKEDEAKAAKTKMKR